MLKKLAFLATIAALGSSVQAANIAGANFASDFTSFRPFTIGTQPMPANSGVVALGSFSMTDVQIQAAAAANDRAGLLAAFTQFATSAVVGDAGGFNTAGLYGKDFSAPINAGNALIGKNIYTFVGNQSTLAGSSQILIMKADPTSVFPEDNPVGVADANLTDPEATIIVGSSVPGVTIPGLQGTFTGAGLVPIPEPAALLTCLLGVLGMAMRRRR
jgi:hypothetical protein